MQIMAGRIIAIALLAAAMPASLSGAFTYTDDADATVPICCRTSIPARPDLIAAVFRADHCEVSNKLAPIIKELQDDFKNEKVLFVALDFTTTDTGRQSQFLCATLGLHDLWSGFRYQTGFIILVDPRDGKVLTKLTRFDDRSKMAAEISRCLALTGVQAPQKP
jgi:thiol-disulfide isomerase/thioredoxin